VLVHAVTRIDDVSVGDSRNERIQVQLVEVDEVDAVLLVSSPEEESR